MVLVSRTLVEIFSDDFLRENLAFRGGTALHKLYLQFKNVEAKEQDLSFTGDMEGLLRPEIHYDQESAFNWLKETLIKKM